MSNFSTLFGAGAGAPIGSLVQGYFAGNSDYLPCDGSTYLSSEYPLLDKTEMKALKSTLSLSTSSSFTSLTPGSLPVSNGVDMAIMATNTTRYLSSSDGVTWTERTFPVAFTRLGYAGSLFFGMNTSTSTFYTSPDGITWTSRTATGATSLAEPSYFNGLYTLISTGGGTAYYYTSPDGVTWTQRNFLTGTGLQPGSGVFINGALASATSESGTLYTINDSGPTTRLLYSGDGLNYQLVPGLFQYAYSTSAVYPGVMRPFSKGRYLVNVGGCSVFDPAKAPYIDNSFGLFSNVSTFEVYENVVLAGSTSQIFISDSLGVKSRVITGAPSGFYVVKLGTRFVIMSSAAATAYSYIDPIDTTKFTTPLVSGENNTPVFLKAK